MKRIENPIHDTVNHLVKHYGARPILRDEAFAYHKVGWAVICIIDNGLFDRAYWGETDENMLDLLDPKRNPYGHIVWVALTIADAKRAVGVK